MTTAVIARQKGDDYQARVFWLEGCRLFSRHSKVARVAYELKKIKAFDDVAVFYSAPIPDERGDRVGADYYQAKYHVDAGGSLTYAALIDPTAIGATKVSLLERLQQAVNDPAAAGARFNLISAWPIHPDDELAQLVSCSNGELRLERLFDGTTDASAKGKVRAAWRKHLQLKSNEELEALVRPLRIHAPYRSLEQLRIELNFRLEFAGLKPVDDGHVGHHYDDLIRKLHANGSHEFDRAALQACCEGEGLWIGANPEPSDRTPLGIRSFLRFAEHLEDETAELLCLLPHFDHRQIRKASDWQTVVAPKVQAFLAAHAPRGGRYLLHLDAHTSIAVLAGNCLNTKSGIDVAVVQRGAGKTAVWDCAAAAPPAAPVVTARVEEVRAGAADFAVALSVTHGIGQAVVEYVRRQVPTVGKVVHVTVNPGPGQQSVRDAVHGFQIAEAAAAEARANRPTGGGVLHLFAAAPNALMFALGRLTPGLGRVQTYDHDFESGDPAAYSPAIFLPVT